MKKNARLFFIGSVIAGFLSLTPTADADSICPTSASFANLCAIRFEDPNLVGRIMAFLLVLAVVLAIIFLIWGGVRWIMANGDKGKIEQARATIIGAIVGLILSLLVYVILSAITFLITGQRLGTVFTIPRLVP